MWEVQYFEQIDGAPDKDVRLAINTVDPALKPQLADDTNCEVGWLHPPPPPFLLFWLKATVDIQHNTFNLHLIASKKKKVVHRPWQCMPRD